MLVAERLASIRGDALVLRDVSFTLAPGGAAIVRGANGAGKSTLIRLIAGLRRPDAGTISWNGHDVREDLPGYARQIAYLGHLDAVKPGLTVAETLNLLPKSGTEAARRAALAAMRLGALADLPARMLSAGQKRRLALARVISAPATLWLLDEPATALDESSVTALGPILARHRAGGGMVIAATHQDLPLQDAQAITL